MQDFSCAPEKKQSRIHLPINLGLIAWKLYLTAIKFVSYRDSKINPKLHGLISVMALLVYIFTLAIQYISQGAGYGATHSIEASVQRLNI